MRYLAILTLLLVSMSTFAGFGGSRGGGFSSSRSSFGGSRSTGFSGRAAPIYRSTPSYSRSAPSVVHNTTVVHSGSSGSGFFTGMMLGHMFSQPQVVVAQPGVQGQVMQPQDSGGMGFFGFVFALILSGAMLYGVYRGIKFIMEN